MKKQIMSKILAWYRRTFKDGSLFKAGKDGEILYMSPSSSKWKPVSDHRNVPVSVILGVKA